MARCYTEINLEIIKNNYTIYKKSAGDRKIIAVVKADAYGHGAERVALSLNSVGCRDFAVSNIDEGIELRKNGVVGDIVVMGYTPVERLNELSAFDLSQALISYEYANTVLNANIRVKVHIAVDTGMNRFGIKADELNRIVEIAERSKKSLILCGVYTHLCVADDEEQADFTAEQKRKFNVVADELKKFGLSYEHCLNSAGGLKDASTGNAVRLGIALYGLKPAEDFELPKGIVPALKWKSEIVAVKPISKGETVGYGRTFTADKDMNIAIVSVGYADGLNRRL